MQIIESKYQKQALNQKNSAGLIDNLKSHVIIETPDDLQNELKSQILQYELQIQILNQNMFNKDQQIDFLQQEAQQYQVANKKLEEELAQYSNLKESLKNKLQIISTHQKESMSTPPLHTHTQTASKSKQNKSHNADVWPSACLRGGTGLQTAPVCPPRSLFSWHILQRTISRLRYTEAIKDKDSIIEQQQQEIQHQNLLINEKREMIDRKFYFPASTAGRPFEPSSA